MTEQPSLETNGGAGASGSPAPSAPAQALDVAREPTPGPTDDRVMAMFWETVKRLPQYVRLASLMARDPRVPKSSKAFLVAGSAYAISPIDLVPGVIPVAGQLDDLYVILTAIKQAIRSCPAAIVEEHLVATGVTVAVIDADLANVRKMVRRGVAWTIRNGGKALAGASKYASTFINKRRHKGGLAHDEKPL